MDLEHVARFVAAPDLIALDDLTMPDRRRYRSTGCTLSPGIVRGA
ncbi:hypothetical protein [Rhodococcus sp. NPDC060176]